jgi:hypothetical protein
MNIISDLFAVVALQLGFHAEEGSQQDQTFV